MFFGKNKNTAISIHALLAESDARALICTKSASRFLSTLSLRRATVERTSAQLDKDVISIHALLAESDSTADPRIVAACISIHALLAESDTNAAEFAGIAILISIHALLAESDYSVRLKVRCKP